MKNIKKKISIMLVLTMFLMVGCGKQSDVSESKFSEFKWPDSEIAKLLPVPKSNIGKIEHESSSSFHIYVGKTTKEDFNTYVDSCKEKGFTSDYSSSDDSYSADNTDGYHLSLDYYEDSWEYKEPHMSIGIWKRSEDNESDESSTDDISSNTEATDDKSSNSETTDNKSDKSNTTKTDKLSPEFKEAMDSYEEFMDEYIKFMKKYTANPTDASVLSDYETYMNKYKELNDQFNKMKNEDLSEDELVYYFKVQNRVLKKMAKMNQ